MPPQSQLRLRLSHPSPAERSLNRENRQQRDDDDGSLSNTSSSSANNPRHRALPLHPPLARSPSKQNTRSPFRLSTSNITLKISTFFILGTFFAVGSIHRLHTLALQATPIDESTLRTQHNGQRNNVPQHLREIRRLGRYPRVVDISHRSESPHSCRILCSPISIQLFDVFPFFRTMPITNDPTQHHEGWNSGDEDNSNSNDEESEKEVKESQCVPMAKWQTTSYPNCNIIHEIDMVRSSGPGSYALPAHSKTRNRRKVTTHPPILRKQSKRILREWPDNKRKKRAKLNARGIVEEADLELLGQGWFRSAWELTVEGIPEYDDEEGEMYRFDESVVLKTLRCVYLSVCSVFAHFAPVMYLDSMLTFYFLFLKN